MLNSEISDDANNDAGSTMATKRLRVLLVNEYYPPLIQGGGEINLELLAKNLAHSGIDTHVLTGKAGNLSVYERRDGVKIHRSFPVSHKVSGIIDNLKRYLFLERKLCRSIRALHQEHDFDIIHLIGRSVIVAPTIAALGPAVTTTVESYIALSPTGSAPSSPIAKTNAKALRKPAHPPACSFFTASKEIIAAKELGKMRNHWWIRYNPVAHYLLWREYRSLNAALYHCDIIAISGYIKYVLAQQGLQSTRIPNLLPARAYVPTSSKKLPWSPGESSGTARRRVRPIVLYLGSYTHYKGPQVLIEASAGLNVKIVCYGEGNLRDDLLRSARLLGVDARINGQADYRTAIQAYRKADIVVFPSLWPEPFGRIAIEAMAAGKPVIASRIGGIPETITNDVGILIDPGNIKQMRDAIKKLASRPDIRRRMGRAGMRAAREYHETTVTGDIMRHYRKMMRQQKH